MKNTKVNFFLFNKMTPEKRNNGTKSCRKTPHRITWAATPVTETCLFPNKYQNILHFETDNSAAPVTEVNKIERSYFICREKVKQIMLFSFNMKKVKGRNLVGIPR
jgi:hypothetical protein